VNDGELCLQQGEDSTLCTSRIEIGAPAPHSLQVNDSDNSEPGMIQVVSVPEIRRESI